MRKLRIDSALALEVGHSLAPGAISARGRPDYAFKHDLAS